MPVGNTLGLGLASLNLTNIQETDRGWYNCKVRLHLPVHGAVLDPLGSAFIWLSWIRILIGNLNSDPGAWKLTKIYFKHIFYGKNKIKICDFIKSEQGPDQDPHGSALFWLPESRSALR
jgi:hypothetical protein